MSLIEAWNDRGLDSAARSAIRVVVDLDADSTTCPGCLETIRLEAGACPSCGLRLA